MATKKFYAVAAGVTPGIYTNWPEAQAQVKGFAGAVFKGFATKEEAVNWLKNPSYSAGTKKKPARKKPSESVPMRTPKAGEIRIYTDGGSINNPGPGGYGAVIVEGENCREISGGFSRTTNNRMELMGCIVALQELERRDLSITLYSDSKYVVNGITKGWAKSWRKNGWIKSDKKPAVNPDLWGQLLELTEELSITFQWVKGHAGNPLNERCDELAVANARRSGLPKDLGYSG
nr:ribonuclease HI [Desulfobulbaceae bacterium]